MSSLESIELTTQMACFSIPQSKILKYQYYQSILTYLTEDQISVVDLGLSPSKQTLQFLRTEEKLQSQPNNKKSKKSKHNRSKQKNKPEIQSSFKHTTYTMQKDLLPCDFQTGGHMYIAILYTNNSIQVRSLNNLDKILYQFQYQFNISELATLMRWDNDELYVAYNQTIEIFSILSEQRQCYDDVINTVDIEDSMEGGSGDGDKDREVYVDYKVKQDNSFGGGSNSHGSQIKITSQGHCKLTNLVIVYFAYSNAKLLFLHMSNNKVYIMLFPIIVCSLPIKNVTNIWKFSLKDNRDVNENEKGNEYGSVNRQNDLFQVDPYFHMMGHLKHKIQQRQKTDTIEFLALISENKYMSVFDIWSMVRVAHVDLLMEYWKEEKQLMGSQQEWKFQVSYLLNQEYILLKKMAKNLKKSEQKKGSKNSESHIILNERKSLEQNIMMRVNPAFLRYAYRRYNSPVKEEDQNQREHFFLFVIESLPTDKYCHILRATRQGIQGMYFKSVYMGYFEDNCVYLLSKLLFQGRAGFRPQQIEEKIFQDLTKRCVRSRTMNLLILGYKTQEQISENKLLVEAAIRWQKFIRSAFGMDIDNSNQSSHNYGEICQSSQKVVEPINNINDQVQGCIDQRQEDGDKGVDNSKELINEEKPSKEKQLSSRQEGSEIIQGATEKINLNEPEVSSDELIKQVLEEQKEIMERQRLKRINKTSVDSMIKQQKTEGSKQQPQSLSPQKTQLETIVQGIESRLATNPPNSEDEYEVAISFLKMLREQDLQRKEEQQKLAQKKRQEEMERKKLEQMLAQMMQEHELEEKEAQKKKKNSQAENNSRALIQKKNIQTEHEQALIGPEGILLNLVSSPSDIITINDENTTSEELFQQLFEKPKKALPSKKNNTKKAIEKEDRAKDQNQGRNKHNEGLARLDKIMEEKTKMNKEQRYRKFKRDEELFHKYQDSDAAKSLIDLASKMCSGVAEWQLGQYSHMGSLTAAPVSGNKKSKKNKKKKKKKEKEEKSGHISQDSEEKKQQSCKVNENQAQIETPEQQQERLAKQKQRDEELRRQRQELHNRILDMTKQAQMEREENIMRQRQEERQREIQLFEEMIQKELQEERLYEERKREIQLNIQRRNKQKQIENTKELQRLEQLEKEEIRLREEKKNQAKKKKTKVVGQDVTKKKSAAKKDNENGKKPAVSPQSANSNKNSKELKVKYVEKKQSLKDEQVNTGKGKSPLLEQSSKKHEKQAERQKTPKNKKKPQQRNKIKKKSYKEKSETKIGDVSPRLEQQQDQSLSKNSSVDLVKKQSQQEVYQTSDENGEKTVNVDEEFEENQTTVMKASSNITQQRIEQCQVSYNVSENKSELESQQQTIKIKEQENTQSIAQEIPDSSPPPAVCPLQQILQAISPSIQILSSKLQNMNESINRIQQGQTNFLDSFKSQYLHPHPQHLSHYVWKYFNSMTSDFTERIYHRCEQFTEEVEGLEKKLQKNRNEILDHCERYCEHVLQTRVDVFSRNREQIQEQILALDQIENQAEKNRQMIEQVRKISGQSNRFNDQTGKDCAAQRCYESKEAPLPSSHLQQSEGQKIFSMETNENNNEDQKYLTTTNQEVIDDAEGEGFDFVQFLKEQNLFDSEHLQELEKRYREMYD